MNQSNSAPFYELNADDHSALLVTVTITLALISISTIVAKLFFRNNLLSLRDFDYALLASTFLLVVQVCLAVAAAHLGLGRHKNTLDASALDSIRKVQYAGALLGISVVACTKTCLCLFIKSINDYGRISIATQVLLWLIGIFFLSTLLATAFQCPLPTPWLAASKEQCPPISPIYTYSMSTNVVTDLLICGLSVAMVWKVQTNSRTKILIFVLFSSRIICPITVIPAMLNLSFLYNGTADFTWLGLHPAVWLEASYNLSVITACVPSLKGLFDSWLGNTYGLNIDAPYELKQTANKSGFEVTANDRTNLTNVLGSAVSQSKGEAQNRDLRLTTSIPNQANCFADGPQKRESMLRTKNKDIKSESMKNLTDGIMVCEEVDVHFGEREHRTASLGSSLGTIDSGDHRRPI